MLDQLLTAFSTYTPTILLMMTAGVFGGLVIGAIPGLTSTMAVALLVPVTFGISADAGLALLVAVYIGSISGGLVSATLLNIPGTPASVTTAFDAYPMAARGEAGKALSYGVFASFLGSLISFGILAFAAPSLGMLALRFNSYEYFALMVFALSCVIAISGKALVKGMLSACLGIFISLIGLSSTDGVARFTLGIKDLEAGFDLMPVLIGMYAISQILVEIESIHQPFKITNTTFTTREFFGVARQFGHSKKNVIRSSIIGTVIGILPGVGPNLANILSYTQAKAQDKNPGSYGTGNPDGIIASEAANNACTGGAMVPLLSLGIPGDASTMMMLGAFMIHGIQPGPLLFRDEPTLVFSILIAYLLSALLMLCLLIWGIRVIIKALLVPRYVLYPVIIGMCVIGSFALNSNMFDVWVFFGMGLGGYMLQRLDFPLLPLVLGLVLGQMTEFHLSACWSMGDQSLTGFLGRPVALGLLVISAGSMAFSLYMRHKSGSASTATDYSM